MRAARNGISFRRTVAKQESTEAFMTPPGATGNLGVTSRAGSFNAASGIPDVDVDPFSNVFREPASKSRDSARGWTGGALWQVECIWGGSLRRGVCGAQ